MITANDQPQPQPLPFHPRTLPKLRGQYHRALEKLYNVARIRHMGYPGPGSERSNVFDLKVGLRIIISREYAPLNPPTNRGPFEHVSFEILSNHFDPKQVNPSVNPLEEAITAYYYISRKSKDVEPIWKDLTPSGIFHMLFPSSFQEGEQDDPENTTIPKKKNDPTQSNNDEGGSGKTPTSDKGPTGSL